MNKWDARMLDLAALIATWSKDPSTGVGAVIVDPQNRVVSMGYNGFPRAVDDSQEALLDRDEKLRRTIHAEDNALLFAQRDVTGCTIYTTHPPCARCAAKIIQAGIGRVVTPEAAEDFVARWADDTASARAMFAEAGVRVDVCGGGLQVERRSPAEVLTRVKLTDKEARHHSVSAVAYWNNAVAACIAALSVQGGEA